MHPLPCATLHPEPPKALFSFSANWRLAPFGSTYISHHIADTVLHSYDPIYNFFLDMDKFYENLVFQTKINYILQKYFMINLTYQPYYFNHSFIVGQNYIGLADRNFKLNFYCTPYYVSQKKIFKTTKLHLNMCGYCPKNIFMKEKKYVF